MKKGWETESLCLDEHAELPKNWKTVVLGKNFKLMFV